LLFSLEHNRMSDSEEYSVPVERPVLLVPGIGNSGPEHWQSCWEARNDAWVRVHQLDWDNPVCLDWMEPLEAAAREAGPQALIAAHSLGSLLVVHWLARTLLKIAGALLVAVPDPDGSNFPAQAVGFAPVPRARISCPSIVIASIDDPYSTLEFTRRCAESWGSRLYNIGKAGHVNASSGLGEWSEGQGLLHALTGGNCRSMARDAQ
jgi:predicted alpha/beta hydrolase family esterase